MSDPDQPTTPPAWYPDPDPQNPGGQRWWDGARWTEHSRPAPQGGQPLYDAGTQTSGPAAQPASSPQQVPPVPPAPAGGPGTYPPVNQQGAYQQAGYQPVYPAQPPGFPRVQPGTSALTSYIWLVVALPLVTAVAFLFVDYSSYFRTVISLSQQGEVSRGDTTQLIASMSGFIVSALAVQVLGVVIYGLSVLFAFFDSRVLARRGFVRPFHWAWTFLTGPVYVIGRTVVARRRGGANTMWPIWGLIAVYVIYFAVVIIKLATAFSAIYDSSYGLVTGSVS
ncbi:DUF2510 domain-containing protein [Planctomonas sp. JC2975]|uniref:DUF2510 domain-containing protein n=1 Tax=Planctomonas sp. JC2975 TaxID=2729626 RepID=UPI0014730622|nr:DUF2510 domain-containing protein [Planctomonas sp. JC2975]NNC11489.1 DUF2510 domain-containing protein [Planctomonas sp. JC2975]